jgi:bleomycin hydrolase
MAFGNSVVPSLEKAGLFSFVSPGHKAANFRKALRLGPLLALALCAADGAPAQSTRPDVVRTLAETPHPNRAGDFEVTPLWPCMNQGHSSVCWSFATSSFVESEMARLKRPAVQLSVMYPVYCEFLAKAGRFVQTRGASRFAAGDMFTALPEACQEYGALPAQAYDKFSTKQPPDQRRLYAELQGLMKGIKRSGNWDEALVLQQVRDLLDRRLGKPPETFLFGGKLYTPKSFAAEVVDLPWADYVSLTSFEYAPFGSFTELRVPDNWQHNTNYFNLPLTQFYEAFKSAVRAGFSVSVSLDITEPSYEQTGRYCIIPGSELRRCALTQDIRERGFEDGSTTDDHAIHIYGYRDFNGEDWFVAKDSWKPAWRHGNHGCVFLHSSYVKLKLLAFLVHRDGLPEEVKRRLGEHGKRAA